MGGILLLHGPSGAGVRIPSAPNAGLTRAPQNACHPLADPRRFPALDALLDSAALVAGLPAGGPSDPQDLLVSVRLGGTHEAYFVDSLKAHTRGNEIIQHVLATVRKEARVELSHFRVRILGGNPAALTLERSILCEPELPPGASQRISYSRTVVTRGAAGDRPQPPPRLRSVTPRLRIGAAGEVRQVDLGSGTGDLSVDRQMQDSYRRLRYRPALLDGRPIEVWLRGTSVEIAR
ncbi:MAG TPA: hypothetical protein VF981_17920 [Gemmatimonadaceae bacterium]